MKQLKRLILIIIGFLSLFLGILGIFLPLLPTTPLLLLAAACFVRSSNRLYDWLINNKWFGNYIQDFRAGRGIPLKAKVAGISTLWLTIGFSALFIVEPILLKLMLIGIASYFTWFILSFKTLRK